MDRVPERDKISRADAVEALLRGDDEPCTCGIVVSEVFQGLRKDATRGLIEQSFRDMPFLEPADIDVYLRAAEVYRKLRERGVTIRSTVDCLIAAIAESPDAPSWPGTVTSTPVGQRDREGKAVAGRDVVNG